MTPKELWLPLCSSPLESTWPTLGKPAKIKSVKKYFKGKINLKLFLKKLQGNTSCESQKKTI